MSIEQLLQANALRIRSDIEGMVQARTANISSEIEAINVDFNNSRQAIISQLFCVNKGLDDIRQAINSRLKESSEQLLSRQDEWQGFKNVQNANWEESVVILNNRNTSDTQGPSNEVLISLWQILRNLMDLTHQTTLSEHSPTIPKSPVYFMDANIHKQLRKFLLHLARGVCQLLTFLWYVF
jgi:hypothetical protein